MYKINNFYILLSWKVPLAVRVRLSLVLIWLGVTSNVWMLFMELRKFKSNCRFSLTGGDSMGLVDILLAMDSTSALRSYISTLKWSAVSRALCTAWSQNSSSSSSCRDSLFVLKWARWLPGPNRPNNTGSNNSPWNNPNRTTPQNTYTGDTQMRNLYTQ